FEMTVDDAADLYSARRVLELSALDSLEDVEEPDLAAFDEAYDRRAEMINTAVADWAPVIAADVDFNRSIVGLHGSPRLLRAFDGIKSELVYCVAVLTTQERRAQQTELLLHEHEELHKAVMKRNSKRAHKVLADHLDHYELEIKKALGERARIGSEASDGELPSAS